MRTLLCASVTLSVIAGVSAQTPAPALRFDVSSVKRSPDGAQPTLMSHPGGLRITAMTLRALVSAAYDIRSERIVGLPPWAASELFEVEARSPFPDTTDQQNWAMLRALLSERFNLAVHEDVRERPIYALVRAGSGDRLGPRIKPSVDCRWAGRVGAASIIASGDEYRCGLSTFSDINGTRIRAGARPISDLARTLDGTGGRPVLDRAGLLGTYSFELQFAAPRPPLALADVTSLPDVFTALEEQLGLKLEPQLGPVRFLVVERAEPPSDN